MKKTGFLLLAVLMVSGFAGCDPPGGGGEDSGGYGSDGLSLDAPGAWNQYAGDWAGTGSGTDCHGGAFTPSLTMKIAEEGSDPRYVFSATSSACEEIAYAGAFTSSTSMRGTWEFAGGGGAGTFSMTKSGGGAAPVLHKGNPFYYPRCTWYAYEKALGDGWRLEFAATGNLDARRWWEIVTNATHSQTPERGEIMVFDAWESASAGHVAYVESVSGDGLGWVISHSNWPEGSGPSSAAVAKVPGGVTIDGAGMVYPVRGFLRKN